MFIAELLIIMKNLKRSVYMWTITLHVSQDKLDHTKQMLKS